MGINNKLIHIRVPEEMLVQLKQDAKDNMRSLQRQVIYIFSEYFKGIISREVT